MLTPVVVDFPLRGEWMTPNTPGTRIPSHGTDWFGETYAYDFVGVDPASQKMRYYKPTLLHYVLLGVPLEDYFGWGQPILASAAGTVVQAEDGWPERNPVQLVRDFLIAVKNTRTYNSTHPTDFRPLTGNYVTVETSDGYAVYAHAQTGSILVSPGDKVVPGQHLANVGHSGNSTAPHLHFQLMDHLDPWKAKGIPCCFREYEVFHNGSWQLVENGIPKTTERLRKL